MFNGIIKNIGRVHSINRYKNNYILTINSNLKFRKKEIGSSISCSGTCLTLEKFKKNLSTFYISKETLIRTNFRFLKKNNPINLEKSMKYGNLISGHFVQGHVDCTSKIKKINFIGKSCFLDLSLQKNKKKFLVTKGSIAINGVSLTISKIMKKTFQVVIIPQTLKLTNLKSLKKNDFVNIEFDVLGKYIINNLK